MDMLFKIDVDYSMNNQFTIYEGQCYHVQEAEATQNAKNAHCVVLKSLSQMSCADPESYVRGGQTSTKFFFYFEGGRIQNTTISGPSSARQGNVIKMTFCWRADDGPTLNAGLVAL